MTLERLGDISLEPLFMALQIVIAPAPKGVWIWFEYDRIEINGVDRYHLVYKTGW